MLMIMSVIGLESFNDIRLTLHEFLAEILLVESMVLDGTNKVVDEKLHDRHDLFLCVVGVVHHVVVL